MARYQQADPRRALPALTLVGEDSQRERVALAVAVLLAVADGRGRRRRSVRWRQSEGG